MRAFAFAAYFHESGARAILAEMKYLGIDYGARRVGVALSDDTGSLAFPIEVVETPRAHARIAQLIAERKVGGLVMGDTRSIGGARNPISAEAERFAAALERSSGMPVARAFEAWSSVEASRFAPEGREHDDAAAAAIILQRFLDARSSRPSASSG